MNLFSKNIRFLRNKKGLNQSEMLSKLGIQRTTWSSYENGVSQPDIDGLIKIANFFGTTVTDLLEKNLSSDDKIIENSNKNKGLEKNKKLNPAIEGQQPVAISFFEIIQSKQKIIESQGQLILDLQNLVNRLTSDLSILIKENNILVDQSSHRKCQS